MTKRKIMICLIILLLMVSVWIFWMLLKQQSQMENPGGTLVKILESKGVFA